LRGASFGLRQSLDTVGAFLAPLVAIGLMLLSADNFTLVFWIAVVPAVASVAILVIAVREPERPAGLAPARWPLTRAGLAQLGPAFWVVVGIAAVFTLARFSEAFLLLRAHELGVPLAFVPVVLVVMNVVYALAAWPAGEWSDRIGRFGILAAGFAMLIAADLVLAFSAGFVGLGIGVALWGLHMGLTQGLLASLIADTAPAELRGTAFGLFNLLSGLAMLAASIVAGALWDVIGPRATFLAGATFTALALMALPMAGRMIRRETAS
jgi:predicted MFS family arabinose efflux permease